MSIKDVILELSDKEKVELAVRLTQAAMCTFPRMDMASESQQAQAAGRAYNIFGLIFNMLESGKLPRENSYMEKLKQFEEQQRHGE